MNPSKSMKLFNLGSQIKQIIDNLFTHYLQNLCSEMSCQTYHKYSQETINITHGLQNLLM